MSPRNAPVRRASPDPSLARPEIIDWGRDILGDLALAERPEPGAGTSRLPGMLRGAPLERDGAYHQGTVWGWLIGPFALARHRVYGDAAAARAWLAPLAHHLGDQGVGSIAEIFDGDAPFTPGGALAQAWSVSETLRVWQILDAG